MSDINQKQTERQDELSPLKRAFIAIETLQEKLAQAQNSSAEAIAIVGMACRLPGEVESPEALWQLLVSGGDGVVHQQQNGNQADARWPLSQWVDADREAAGKTVTLDAGLIKDYDKFDARFFGISPREAESMDPQQRLALELSYSAAQDAGYLSTQLEGSNTGVYLGAGAGEYFRQCLQSTSQDAGFFVTGNTQNVISGRIAFNMGLQGPAIVIDTACSSSLAAIHLAINALRKGECQAALAGGVNMLVDPAVFVSLSKANMLSADGACKTFDHRANGYVRAEGGAIFMLKTLSQAKRDGDRIHALICGSAVNQDGRSSSLTAPNGPAQQNVIRKALADARIDAASVDYIESHGTGTSLGDPIEVHALNAVYGQRTSTYPLFLGALKSNIGHLEAASGAASLIKVVMALKQRQIPGNLHFQQANQHFDIANSPIVFPTGLTSWESEQPRRAGVSSFGFSGTNCHVILQEAPDDRPLVTAIEGRRNLDAFPLLALSAASGEALRATAARYQRWLTDNPTLSLMQVGYSAAVKRDQFEYRVAFTAASRSKLTEQLAAFASESQPVKKRHRPRVGFLFSGQGAQYAGMGHELYRQEPVFRDAIDRCQRLLVDFMTYPLTDVLWGEHQSLLNQTAYTQPALFSVQYALVTLWASWGVQPTVVMGHSVGEFAAACCAGVLALEEAIRLIAERGRLMQQLPAGGGMLVVMGGGEQVNQLISANLTMEQQQRIGVAAFNADSQTVLSGDLALIEKVKVAAETQHMGCVALPVSHAFHSPLMQPVLAAFEQYAANVCFNSANIAVVSTVTGEQEQQLWQQPQYWSRHISAPVNFLRGLEVFSEQVDVVIEIGPQPVLTALAQRSRFHKNIRWLCSINTQEANVQSMQQTLAVLYGEGVDIDWQAWYQQVSIELKNCSLPVYPYQRQRFWVTPEQRGRLASPSVKHDIIHPLLGQRLLTPGVSSSYYQSFLSTDSPGYLEHHRLFGSVIVPGASHVSMAIMAIQDRYLVGACELQTLAFFQTIGIADEGQRRVQMVLTPEMSAAGSIRGEFKVLSLRDERHGNDEHDWDVNASGVYSELTDPSVALAAELATLNIASAQQEWALEQRGEDFYTTIWQRGYTLGSGFCWVGDRWSKGGLTLHAMVVPELPDELSSYPLYPGLVDSCFQAFGSSVALDASDDDIYIPFCVERMKFFRQPRADESLWCLSRPHAGSLAAKGGAIRHVGDLVLFTSDGEVILDVQGLELRKSTARLLKGSLPGMQASYYYHSRWLPATKVADGIEENGLVILLAPQGESEALATLGACLDERGIEWVMAYGGEQFAALPESRFTLRIDVSEDYLALFKQLGTQGYPGPSRIITLFSPPVLAEGEGASALLPLALSATALVQACQQAFSQRAPQIALVTQQAQACLSRSETIVAEHYALWSLWRVIRGEQPQLKVRAFDLDSTQPSSMRLLCADIFSQSPENEVGWRDGQRLVHRFSRYDAVATSGESQKLALDPAGTYLLTGALGGIGLATMRWLVQRGARHLLLLVRHAPSDQQQEALNALQRQGVTLTLCQCALDDAEQVKAAVQQIAEQQSVLRGVFHLAGALDDKLIEKQDINSYANVFAPKVQATRHLDAITRHPDVQYFVCFSSVAAILGTPGQANYAAANGYLDVVVRERQRAGFPALSVNWGPWRHIGMAARQDDGGQKIAAMGMEAFEPEQGFASLEALLFTAAECKAVVACLQMQWQRFMQRFPGAENNSLFQEFAVQSELVRGSYLAALAALPVGERQALLSLQISGVLKAVMKFAGDEEIDLDLGFFDSGMDSLMSLEFRQQLEKLYDITLPPTVAFNYPTLRDLMGYFITDVLALDFSESNIQPESASATLSMDSLLTSELSEDVLARMLEEQLAAMAEKE